MRIIISFFFVLVLPLVSMGKDSTLFIPFNKTVHVFFPHKVTYYDVGSPDILIDSSGNMIKLKAGVEFFESTNLTVITKMDEVFHFVLQYNENPGKFVYRFASSVELNAKVEKSLDHDNFNKSCLIAESKAKFTDMGVIDKRARFLLKDIFIHEDFLYFVLEIKNESNIVYDIDLIRFVAKNKKVLNSKKYAIQETVIDPTFILNESVNSIGPTFSLTKVFVTKKFTIAEDKKLFFELWEKGGDRQLNFSVDYKKILKAKKL